MRKILLSIIIINITINICFAQWSNTPLFVQWKEISPGDACTEKYFYLLENKRIALVANHTSIIGNIHLADSLINAGLNLVKVFSPEHGFRGDVGAGEFIANGIDTKTGLSIVSLYGSKRKPTKEDLQNIDILLFDIQDVGVRFYTYLSTMSYVMEACAEFNIPMIILDRPNPNGFYVDGPILNYEHKSFVGMHPVPIVHGMTLGEYALMINGELWLTGGIQCDLQIIKVENYTHNMIVDLPIKPSPNLPNLNSILLYPSLCLFEGTNVSVGRGSVRPFEYIGHPDYPKKKFSYTPIPVKQASLNPPYQNQKCYGENLESYYERFPDSLGKIELSWLIEFFQKLPNKNNFFNEYFEKLSGTNKLRQQIQNGWTSMQIEQSWKNELNTYKKIRSKYLLYPDFE